MKAHLLNQLLHFPKQKRSLLRWSCWGLAWVPYSFQKNHRPFQPHWTPQLPRAKAEMLALHLGPVRQPPPTLGPTPNGQLLGCSLTKYTRVRHTKVAMRLLLLSHFSRVQLCATPQRAAHPPPSLGFFRQEHWNGSTLPSPMHESEM